MGPHSALAEPSGSYTNTLASDGGRGFGHIRELGDMDHHVGSSSPLPQDLASLPEFAPTSQAQISPSSRHLGPFPNSYVHNHQILEAQSVAPQELHEQVPQQLWHRSPALHLDKDEVRCAGLLPGDTFTETNRGRISISPETWSSPGLISEQASELGCIEPKVACSTPGSSHGPMLQDQEGCLFEDPQSVGIVKQEEVFDLNNVQGLPACPSEQLPTEEYSCVPAPPGEDHPDLQGFRSWDKGSSMDLHIGRVEDQVLAKATMPPPHHGWRPNGDEPYAQLIFYAFLAAPNHTLSLQEIYSWFRKYTDKAATPGKGWQNSVRHNLSMNAAFSKVDQASESDSSSSTRRSTLWVLEQWALREGIQSTTRYRRGGNSRKQKGGANKARIRTQADYNMYLSKAASGRKGGWAARRSIRQGRFYTQGVLMEPLLPQQSCAQPTTPQRGPPGNLFSVQNASSPAGIVSSPNLPGVLSILPRSGAPRSCPRSRCTTQDLQTAHSNDSNMIFHQDHIFGRPGYGTELAPMYPNQPRAVLPCTSEGANLLGSGNQDVFSRFDATDVLSMGNPLTDTMSDAHWNVGNDP